MNEKQLNRLTGIYRYLQIKSSWEFMWLLACFCSSCCAAKCLLAVVDVNWCCWHWHLLLLLSSLSLSLLASMLARAAFCQRLLLSSMLSMLMTWWLILSECWDDIEIEVDEIKNCCCHWLGDDIGMVLTKCRDVIILSMLMPRGVILSECWWWHQCCSCWCH